MTPAEERLAKIRAKRDRKPRRKLPAIYHYQMPSVEEQRQMAIKAGQNIANLILSGLEQLRIEMEAAGRGLIGLSNAMGKLGRDIEPIRFDIVNND